LLAEHEGLIGLALLAGGSQCLHIPSRISLEVFGVRVLILRARGATAIAAPTESLGSSGRFQLFGVLRADPSTHLLRMVYLLLVLLAFDLGGQTGFGRGDFNLSREILILLLRDALTTLLILHHVRLVALSHPAVHLGIAHARVLLLQFDLRLVFAENVVLRLALRVVVDGVFVTLFLRQLLDYLEVFV